MQMAEREKDVCVAAIPTDPRIAPLNGAGTIQSIHVSAHAADDAWHDLPHPKGAIPRTDIQVRILRVFLMCHLHVTSEACTSYAWHGMIWAQHAVLREIHVHARYDMSFHVYY